MQVLIALAILSLALSYIYVLARRADVGLVSLLAVKLYDFTFGLDAGVLGGIHLTAFDLVAACLLAAGAVRTISNLTTLNAIRLLSCGYLALFALSLGRGLLTNGIFSTSNEARSFLGPLIAMIYFLNAPTDEKAVRRYVAAYLAFGSALCIVAVLAAAGLPVGISAETHLDVLAGASGRYLPAAGAAAICLCAFFSLASRGYQAEGVLNRLLPAMFLFVAIYLRHRTVWLMLAAGTAALAPVDGKLFRRIVPTALFAMVAVSALVLYANTRPELASETEFADAASNQGTWRWRVNGWQDLLLDSEQNPASMLIGKTMGNGFWRIDPETHLPNTVAPHSEYVTEYLRVGILGTVCVTLFALWPLGTLGRAAREDQTMVYPSASAWTIIILVTLVYGITYGIDAQSYALIGIANAIALGLNAPGEVEDSDALEEWEIESARQAAESWRGMNGDQSSCSSGDFV